MVIPLACPALSSQEKIREIGNSTPLSFLTSCAKVRKSPGAGTRAYILSDGAYTVRTFPSQ